jgi:hypothetical protein
LGRIDAKFTKYPPVATQPGRYAIQQVKERETRYGRALILTLANARGEKFSLFVAYPSEISDKSLLARLTRAFGHDTEAWLGKKIDLTYDRNDRRRINPLPSKD